ncbi:ABC-three component system middle component 6 [Pseudoalteromonas rubra]|uniref:Uncharacterized protein n=1 Tax=Pseudoalteromonas rubra TaxID=43658 RepID=A0A5S3X1Z6_9GAMM|nr:ABC-three component system middle component 6 [Pseudoalteromonas rubra]TMP38280.1 hypothetical protein CWB98_07280 [Pseudoalteromonas rubra]
MILPTKLIKPEDSLYCISAFIVDVMQQSKRISFDDLLDEVNYVYPKKVEVEKIQLCLDFLFIIGKLELENETLKVVL